MKKFLLVLFIGLFLLDANITFSAETICRDSDGAQIPCGVGTMRPNESTIPGAIPKKSLKENVMTIVNYLLGFMGLVGVVSIVWAGVLIIVSRGEGKSTDSAKNIITYVIIGFVIIFLSYSFVATLTGVFEGGGGTTSGGPSTPGTPSGPSGGSSPGGGTPSGPSGGSSPGGGTTTGGPGTITRPGGSGIPTGASGGPGTPIPGTGITTSPISGLPYVSGSGVALEDLIMLPDGTLVPLSQVQIGEGTFYKLPDGRILGEDEVEILPDGSIRVKSTNEIFPRNQVEVLKLKTYKTPDGKIYRENQVTLYPKGSIISNESSKKKIIAMISANPTDGNAPLTVSFDGMQSYDPNTNSAPIATENYAWFLIDKSGKETIIGQGPLINYTFNEDGQYLVKLRVFYKDNKDSVLSGEANQRINVSPQKTKIVLKINNLNARSINRLNTDDVLKNGVLFDPKDTIIQKGRKIEEYIWDFGNGSKDSYSTPEQIIQNYTAAGEYNINLKAKDNIGEITEGNFKLIIEPLSAFIEISPKEGFSNQAFQISGEKSKSSDSFIKGFNWNITNSKGESLHKSSEQNFIFTPKIPDVYSVSLVISNNKGDTKSSVEELKINSTAPVALFNASQKSANKPGIFVFDGGVSFDAEEEKLRYSWDFNGDGIYEIIDSDSSKEEYTFKKKGTYVSKLKVKDIYNNESIYKKNIEVTSILNVDFDIDRVAVQKGSKMTFTPITNGASSIYWEFGDGSKESTLSEKIEHIFQTTGVYSVTMTAINSEQDKNSITRDVYIGDGNYPIGVFYVKVEGEYIRIEKNLCGEGKNGIIVSRNDNIEFDAKDSVNIDNSDRNLSYTWDFGDGTYAETRAITHNYKITNENCFGVNIKVKDIKSDKISKVSNTVWVKVVNKKPIIGQIMLNINSMPINNTSEYLTPIKVFASLPIVKDYDGEIKKYKWWYHKPFMIDEKLGLTETFEPTNYFEINANGIKGLTNEYVFTVEVTDNEGGSVSNEESYGYSQILKIKNGETQKFITKFTVSKNQVLEGESITFYPSVEGLNENVLFQWDFDGDGTIDESSNKNEITHSFDKKGYYDVELRVENKQNNVERVYKRIYVNSKIIQEEIKETKQNNENNNNNNIPEVSTNPTSTTSTQEIPKEEKGDFSSIQLKGEGIPITILNLRANKIEKNKYKIRAQVSQANSVEYKGEVEFIIKSGVGEIINTNANAIKGVAETEVVILKGKNIEIEATAKDTVYGDLKESVTIILENPVPEIPK